MTRRVLIRAGKSPFEVVSAEDTLASNLIGNNSGNLLFSTAAFKILSAGGTEVVANGLTANPADADRINDEYDCFVIPLANAYRPGFQKHLIRFTRLVERLKIPVVVLSSGAQSTHDLDVAPLREIEGTVKNFIRAVLDRSASIGVRGEFTGDYLNQLGFKDVDVIGCPSMFLFGDRMSVTRSRRGLRTRSRISLNASANVREMGKVIMSHHRRYPNLTYAAQGKVDLELLLWGEPATSATSTSYFPTHMSHPLYAENRIRFFLDPWTWIRHLKEYDFSFGTRIHGNIVALLAGTPACVIAHDSRTLELSRYFEIPHVKLSEVGSGVDARKLYEQADFTGLNRNHGRRFATFIEFVERNGLPHIFSDPKAAAAFDARLDKVPYPPPVEAAPHATTQQLVDRMRWLRARHDEGVRAIRQRVAALEATVRAGDSHR